MVDQKILLREGGTVDFQFPQSALGQSLPHLGTGQNGDPLPGCRAADKACSADALYQRGGFASHGLQDGVHAVAGAAAGLPQQQGVPRQRLKGQRGLSREIRRGADCCHLLLPQKIHHMTWRDRCDVVHQRKINFIALDHLLRPAGVLDKGLDADSGQFPGQTAEDRRQAGLADGDGHTEAAVTVSAAVPQDPDGLFELSEYRVGVLQQAAAGVGDVDAAVHPLQKLHAIEGLQLLDRKAHRGLGHVQVFRSQGDALPGTDRPEDLQMTQRHSIPSITLVITYVFYINI